MKTPASLAATPIIGAARGARTGGVSTIIVTSACMASVAARASIDPRGHERQIGENCRRGLEDGQSQSAWNRRTEGESVWRLGASMIPYLVVGAPFKRDR